MNRRDTAERDVDDALASTAAPTGSFAARCRRVASPASIRAITTSEIKFSVLIDAAYTELAVRTLHTLYGLDQV